MSPVVLRALWRVLSEGPDAGGISHHIDAAAHAALARQGRDAERAAAQAAAGAAADVKRETQR